MACQTSTAIALPLHSLQGKCCRCRESCSACATCSSAAPGEKVPSSECARTDEGSEGGFLLTPGWSPQRPFPFFGAKRKITPPPPPFVKPPSPPSLPQHRRQFTRLQCFQAAQQKATKAPSGRARFPRILSRRGAFHPHRCLSQWCDRRHFRGLHVRQSGKRSLAVRPLPCPSCSLNRMHSASFIAF